ncbi:hypothetical protein WA158_008252 [Blastocystis sp. Blastoise]
MSKQLNHPDEPAYAQIVSTDFCSYANKLPIILGRASKQNPDGFIDISPVIKDQKISRQHAVIDFNHENGYYTITNNGRQSIIVDHKSVLKGNTVALSSCSSIRIGSSLFYFRLPKDKYVDIQTIPVSEKRVANEEEDKKKIKS